MTKKRNGSGEPPKKAKRQPTGDYPVGNCRPPKEHQFQKGQPSPNPAGRPRGKPKSVLKTAPLNPQLAKILELSQETMKVNGVDTPLIDAAFKQLVRLALVEKREKSLHKLLDLHAAAQQGAFDEKLELVTYAVAHKEKWQAEFARCEADGRPTPNILPHPEDVTFDGEGNVIILEAVDEESKRLQDFREDALRNRLCAIEEIREVHGPNPRDKETDALLRRLEREAARLNKLLPPRLQVQKGIKRSEAVAELKRRGLDNRPTSRFGTTRRKSGG